MKPHLLIALFLGSCTGRTGDTSFEARSPGKLQQLHDGVPVWGGALLAHDNTVSKI